MLMARAVETKLEIDGREVRSFISLKLSQGIYAHHEFRLECFAEALGKDLHSVFNESADLIGASIHIQVTPVQEQLSLTFSGVITEVAVGSENGHPGIVVISGASATILLDQGPQSKSWMRESVNSMVKDVLKQYYADWLQYKIDPAYKETIYYEVQYNETAWQFITRLAGRFGEWLFYDGQKLVLGTPKDTVINLTYGIHLSRFVQGVELRAGKLQVKMHNYVKNEVIESVIENIAGYTGHEDVGAKALAKGEEMFGTQTKCWYPHMLKEKKHLDAAMSLRAAIQNSDIVRMTGCSDLPGLGPGDRINIKKEEMASDYRIISIEHCWDGTGNYTNEFVAIPASVKKAPAKPVKAPYCATQGAIVVDNYDKANLGRVQVRFHWMSEKEISPFIRMVSPYTGEGNGLYMKPEVGAEVWVAFADGNATLPYIIGVVNNGSATALYEKKGNHIKAIQTRSGIKIIMNDENGSVLIADKNGNKLELDGEGVIRIDAKEVLELASGESKIAMNRDGTIKIIGKEVEIDTAGAVKMISNDSIDIKAAENVAVTAAKITLN
jgi:Rhs element Vgr protein